jgi:hypothetical protein
LTLKETSIERHLHAIQEIHKLSDGPDQNEKLKQIWKITDDILKTWQTSSAKPV